MHATPPVHPLTVAALYRFAALDGLDELRGQLLGFCRENGIKGTLLLAAEGVNGTVAGTDAAVAALLERLVALRPALSPLDVKLSRAVSAEPFRRTKVRIKREIVTMGVDDIDPRADAGTYVEPGDWNALLSDPDTVLIDTRNAYEVALGTFGGAIDPGTESFRDFPRWAEDNKAQLEGKRVAMFCTGGIRCEKASAYLRRLGPAEVFHLKGGILRYLEDVSPEDSLWQGECFVFDERVGLRHGLQEGEASLCRACRRPLTPEDRASPLYREGIACAACVDERSEADRARFAERQRQAKLAAAREGE